MADNDSFKLVAPEKATCSSALDLAFFKAEYQILALALIAQNEKNDLAQAEIEELTKLRERDAEELSLAAQESKESKADAEKWKVECMENEIVLSTVLD